MPKAILSDEVALTSAAAADMADMADIGGYGGYGGGGYYGGYYPGFCGPIQLTLGLCGPWGY